MKPPGREAQAVEIRERICLRLLFSVLEEARCDTQWENSDSEQQTGLAAIWNWRRGDTGRQDAGNDGVHIWSGVIDFPIRPKIAVGRTLEGANVESAISSGFWAGEPRSPMRECRLQAVILRGRHLERSEWLTPIRWWWGNTWLKPGSDEWWLRKTPLAAASQRPNERASRALLLSVFEETSRDAQRKNADTNQQPSLTAIWHRLREGRQQTGD
jgi:hypothetical protein